MARYATVGTRAASTTLTTALGWHGTAAIRLKINYLSVACTGVPADTQVEVIWQRYTADGTPGSAVTPKPLDSSEVAAVSAAGQAHSVEPTYTAAEIMLWDSFHMRGRLVWYAPPGGEILCPAQVEDGMGVQVDASAGTPTVVSTMHGWE